MKAFRLGLTGSIGMGKTTTAGFFRAAGLPVWDADEAVQRLYAPGGAALPPLAAAFPAAVSEAGVSRETLREILQQDPSHFARLEAIVHPLVAQDRAAFLTDCQSDIVVCDIPLLFEHGTEQMLDATLLVTAPAELQRARVLARRGMTEAQFNLLLSRQMPDAEKRGRATHILETLSLPAVEAGVAALIDYIRRGHHA